MARDKKPRGGEFSACPWKDCPCYGAAYQAIDPCDEGQLAVCRRIRTEISAEISREEAKADA